MKEIIASVVLVALLVLLLNPFGFWMPTSLQMVILGAAIAAFGTIAAFVLRERASDEREEAHRSFSGRLAFLAGSAVLLFGIVLQSLDHAVDPWLVAVLASMILAKLAARLYGDRFL